MNIFEYAAANEMCFEQHRDHAITVKIKEDE